MSAHTTGSSTARSSGPAPLHAVTRPLAAVASPLLALLDARAADELVLRSSERRFFVRYDAWTFPALRAVLEDPAQVKKLSPAARRLFVDDMPPFEHPAGVFTLLAHVLGRQVLDRMEKFCTGGEMPAVPDLLDEERQILAKWGLTLDRALLAMAEYHERIFDAAFPAKDDRPSLALEGCIACFSAGMLHFVPAKTAPAKGSSERTIGDPLNAEPDGWLYFAFAEFAWQAARVRTERSGYWLALAQHFAAMEEVYAWTYGPAIGPRDAGSYARWRRRAGDPVAMREMLELSALYRAKYPTSDALAKRLAYNALRAFRDKR